VLSNTSVDMLALITASDSALFTAETDVLVLMLAATLVDADADALALKLALMDKLRD
jgi:hypothetical protein